MNTKKKKNTGRKEDKKEEKIGRKMKEGKKKEREDYGKMTEGISKKQNS